MDAPVRLPFGETLFTEPAEPAARPRLGLALGSGSARGWCHLGVIRALLEHGIEPDCVAGCSMGAMVGAAYASGSLERIEAWARSLDWRRILKLLDIGWPSGLIKGNRLLELFQAEFLCADFSDLRLPFAAVATDLVSGEEVWLRQGGVAAAVRASCTIPGLFEPVWRDGRCLVDGGLVNPVPVSLCRALGAETIIAVNLGPEIGCRFTRLGEGPAPTLNQRLIGALFPRHPANVVEEVRPTTLQPSISETFLGAIDIMQDRIAQSHLAADPADAVVTPQLRDIGMFDYHRAAQAVDEGYRAVEEMLPAIRETLDAVKTAAA